MDNAETGGSEENWLIKPLAIVIRETKTFLKQ